MIDVYWTAVHSADTLADPSAAQAYETLATTRAVVTPPAITQPLGRRSRT